MENKGYQEIRKILNWYMESEEDRDGILGSMENDIDPVIYVESLRYFLEHAMDSMALFFIFKGSCSSRAVSEA